MTDIMKFEFEKNKKLECIELNNEPVFNPYSVGKWLGMTKYTIRNHIAEINRNKRVFLKNPLNGFLPKLNIPPRGVVLPKKPVFYVFRYFFVALSKSET